MRVAGDGLGVHVLVELHVARVDAEDLQPPVLVGDADVDLAVEAWRGGGVVCLLDWLVCVAPGSYMTTTVWVGYNKKGRMENVRPKRRRAGSMALGRLVAPMTTTEARFFIPSISVSSCETMRRSTC